VHRRRSSRAGSGRTSWHRGAEWLVATLCAWAPAAAQPAVAPAVAPDASVRGVRVAGTVADSVGYGVTPLAGATVQLVERANPAADRTTATDARGRFVLDAVPPGRYLVGFVHPRLDVLGVELRPREVEVPATGLDPLDLATPGPRVVRRAICGPAVTDSAGVVVGVVRDADTGSPVAGAAVTFSWNELALTRDAVHRRRREVAAVTQPGGGYAACGLPTDDDVLAEVRAPGRASGVLQLSLDAAAVHVQEFALGDSTSARLVAAPAGPAGAAGDARPAARRSERPVVRVARGTARLEGTVRHDDGSPATGAEVLVWGTGLRARAGDDGTFAIGGLPAGTFEAEARALGFAPHRAPVALASGRAATVALVLDSRAATLGAVTVRGTRSRRGRVLDGFLRRRREGAGQFLTAADLERMRTPLVSDALRTLPGVNVQHTGRGTRLVRLRGGCVPQVVLDGTLAAEGTDDVDALVRPLDVVGIEVYTDAAGLPAEWSGARTNSCGVVAIWTKI